MKKCLILAVAAVLLAVVACDSDTEKPTVTIVFPADGANLGTGAVVIKAVAEDNKAVIKVEFFDGATKIGEDGTATADTFDVSWTATAGAHTLKAVAWDGANNRADHSVSVTVTGAGGPTYHEGEIAQDETWWPSGNPHIITSDVYLGTNATLTIKPGCIVRFAAGTELYCGWAGVSGAIVAEGTADSTILFTSNVASPAPGDWQSVGVYENAMSNTSFRYCTFEYGGEDESYGMFAVEDIGARISNCTFRKSATYGINVRGQGHFREFNNNVLTECVNYPLNIHAEYVRTLGAGNSFSGNTKNGIYVRGGAVTTTGTWPNPGVPYFISYDVNIGSNANSPVITIAPGTTVKLHPGVEFYCGWTESGGIVADGTTGRIRFTSSVPAPSRGDWQSIGFYSYTIDAVSKLINCTVEFGGGDGYGNVVIQDALPTVQGDSIGYSQNYGIYLDGTEYPSPATLRANNTFYNNLSGDIREP